MFADAINLPLVAALGLAILVPLLAFEVGVEGWVLRRAWRRPFREMAILAFWMNYWSLVAGIPVKIGNALIGEALLTGDLVTWFARHPWVAALGALNYVLVTLAVESACAWRWRRRVDPEIPGRRVLLAVLAANLATNAVLVPVYGLLTRPRHNIAAFSPDTRWAPADAPAVLYLDPDHQHLWTVRPDGSGAACVVPVAMKEYLISQDLEICVFRSVDNALHHHRRGTGITTLLWREPGRVRMREVAFSPSGDWVALAGRTNIEVVHVPSGQRRSTPVLTAAQSSPPLLAWTTVEEEFLENSGNTIVAAQIDPASPAIVREAVRGPSPAFLDCYGQAGGGSWSSGTDWGALTPYRDRCGDLEAWALPGLGSYLLVGRQGRPGKPLVRLAANPGLLGISWLGLSNPAFLPGCGFLVFQAGDSVCLLDVAARRVGRLARGTAYVLTTSRDRKVLEADR